MSAAMPARTVLFLCTGNYYRSRFAEVVFNATARKMGLDWIAISSGLALERGTNNVGPMAKSALEKLQEMNLTDAAIHRKPQAATAEQIERANWIVALLEAEHRPLLQERFAGWEDRAEYWHVEDRLGVLPEIEREVMDLISRLMRGGVQRTPGSLPTPAAPVLAEKPAKKLGLARVGRETAGRRGKGVTTVFDLTLGEAELKELATKLKNLCGTGGTCKDGRIEIQGEHRDKIVAELTKMGFQVKRSGG
jgi:predicted translation initiation factor SUI1